MTLRDRLRRFHPHGVFWRHFLAWAVNNVPAPLEVATMWLWSFFFFALWGAGRRGVARNLAYILPGSSRIANVLRAYRVFLNFAWTIADSARFHASGIGFDWEIRGGENLDALSDPERHAIVLTAHMGNYDIGSLIFTNRVARTMSTVRAPEHDPETHAFALEQQKKYGERLKVHYNVTPETLAFDLVEAIGRGEVVAIQGDRALPGVTARPAPLFGASVELPAGPFALAMATRAEIFPLFIMRAGRRRYRVIAAEPIQCQRTQGSKEIALAAAMSAWAAVLETTIRENWDQWFTFEAMKVRPEHA
ncbi:MAG: lysophospholipid acyltransferase family protein [Acidobacteria bacterium]|nr:lysophospholipid acyltransferase family protein [Acidobacteriota bacterium]